MARHVDRARIRAAKLAGAAQRLRHLTITEPDAYEDLRRAWSELCQRVDRVVELVDHGVTDDGPSGGL